jgi:hypothetical protein
MRSSSTRTAGRFGLLPRKVRSLRVADRRRRFQFCMERFQSVGRLFLQQCNFVVLAGRQPESRLVSRAPVYHILWVRGFRALPFPGADSIFSSRCGAISGRLHFAVTPSRAAIPPKRLGSKDRRFGSAIFRRESGAGTNVEQTRSSGKKFVERLGNDSFGPRGALLPRRREGTGLR